MKDSRILTIRSIIREQKLTEKEYFSNIYKKKFPDAVDAILNQLYALVEKEARKLKVSICPEIVLDYSESQVYLRLLPIEAAPLMNTTLERNKLYPSRDLVELLGVKKYEIYSLETRKEICRLLSKEIKKRLKSDGARNIRISEIPNEWSTMNTQISIKFE